MFLQFFEKKKKARSVEVFLNPTDSGLESMVHSHGAQAKEYKSQKPKTRKF